MSKYSNTIEYKLRTSLDSSGIAKLQTQLRQVETELQKLEGRGVYTKKQVESDLKNVRRIQTALQEAFNPKLGMLDNKKFIGSLTQGGKSLQSYVDTFNAAGVKGAQAFAGWYGQLGKIDTGMKQISKTTDKVFNTLGNTVRWGLIASGFAAVMNSVHQASQYVRDLDESLTNIMMVTGYSKDQMNEYAKIANETAKALKSTTVAMTDATLVFAQQGYDIPTSQKLAGSSVKLANVSQQDTATASDEITAYMNAFKIPLEKIDNALSKWAIVANVSAADVEELSVASQKAASTANTVGVNMDQLAAQIAAIETVTREAPENIGNGLKTLYARFSDIRMGETLDDGVDLGKVTSTLEKVGVDVVTAEGNMRQVGDIMEDLMEVWGGLDLTQRSSIATTLAGKFQLSRFTALMNRSDLYQEYLTASENETGTETLDMMQETFENSIQGRLNKLQSTIENIFTNAFNTDDFYSMIDAVTELVQVFADLTEAIGGGGAALTAFGAIATKIFSTNISRGLTNMLANRETAALKQQNIDSARANAIKTIQGQGLQVQDADAQRVIDQTVQGAQYAHLMNDEDLTRFNQSLEDRVQALHNLKIAEEEQDKTLRAVQDAYKQLGVAEEAAEQGLLGFTEMLRINGVEVTKVDLEQGGFIRTMNKMAALQPKLSGVANAFEELQQAEKKFGTGSTQWDTAFDKVRDSASALGKEIRSLIQEGSLSEESFQDLSRVLKQLDTVVDGDYDSLNKLQQEFKESQTSVNFVVEAMHRLVQEGRILPEELDKVTQRAEEAREALNSLSAVEDYNNSQRAIQEEMYAVTNAVSSIGQLAFSWQAFKSLGSIWVDSDIDTGKKIEETVLNLSMNLPMLIFGFNQLKQAADPAVWSRIATGLTATAAAENRLTLATLGAQGGLQGAGIAATATAAKNSLLAASSKAAAIAVSSLGKALNFLTTGPGIVIIGAIMAVGAAMSYMAEQAEKAKQAEVEALDGALAHSEEIKNTAASWEELYQEYEKTGKISQELVDAGGALGESLDIIGAKALAAAGDFDTLNARVQAVKDQGYQEIIDASNNLIDGQYGRSLRGEEWFNGSATSDYYAALRAALKQTTNGQGELINYSSVSNILEKHRLGSGGDYIDAIRESKLALQELREEQEKLNQVTESDRDDTWQKRSDDIQLAINKLEEFRTGEDIQQAEKAIQDMYNARINMSDFQEKLDSAGTNAQKIIDVFANDTSTKMYFSDMISEVDRYAEALKNVTDIAQQAALSQEHFKKKIQAEFMGTDNDQFIRDFAPSLLLADSAIQDRYTQQAIAEAIKQVNEANLSDEDLTSLYASVDWSQPIEQILGTLVASAEKGVNYGSTQVETQDNEYRETRLKEIYKVDENAQEVYREWAQEAEMMIDTQEHLNEIRDETQEVLAQYSKAEIDAAKATEKEGKALSSTQKEMLDAAENAELAADAAEQYTESVDDLADMVMQSQKGLDSLSENWEKNAEILSNEALRGTLEYAEALGSVKESMADVLNVKPEDLSNNFIINNLEKINELALGNISVLQELRAEAGHEILVSMNDNGSIKLTSDELTYLEDQLNTINETEYTAYTSIDDTDFINKLNEMLESGAITADQLNTVLNAWGIDPQLDWIEDTRPAFTIPGIDAKITGPFGLEAPIHVDPITVESTVRVPQINALNKMPSASVGSRAPHISPSGGYRPSSGSSSKGSGGSGKEPKAEEPKDVSHKEVAEVEKDIYEKINAWLEKLQDDYSKLKKIRDRTWNRDAIKHANKELGLLKSQHKALQDRIKISKEYQRALLGDSGLKSKYNVKNSLNEYGLTDNDLDGIVDNYSQQWDIAKRLAEQAQRDADSYFEQFGGRTGKDQYGNTVIIKNAEMLGEQANHYEELTKTAENAWNLVKQINEVTKEYEDTANKIRDDEEQQLDLLHQMEDIQIELYQNALDALDTIEDMHDLMSEMKGMWSGFELDSPFRATVQDVQEIKDFFSGDTKKEIRDYYQNIYDEIDKRNDLTAKEKQQAKKFFKSEERNALTAEGYNNLGFGELAAESRKLAELQEMEKNEVVRRLVYGTNTKQWEEDFQEQVKKVEKMALEVEEAWEKALNNIIDALDEEAEALDKLYDKYNDVIDRVEREADRISLFYGEDQYADLSKLADKAGKVQLEKAKKYQQEYNYWETKQNAIKEQEERERNYRLNEAKQVLNSATTAQEKREAELLLEQAKQYHSEEWEWYDERMREAHENALEAQDEAAESFKKAYEYAIDEIEAQWLKSALGTRDANYLLDDWNRDKDFMTTYKDEFERQYEIEKLNYKWRNMLNDALGASLTTQRKIKNEGQEILDGLANQVTMSEYDVKLANARLEVLQKQIALEDAQRNKNQMKLRRDSQGNYKYVYAADKNDVDAKQSDLLDSIYDVWEISKEQSIDSTTNYVESVQQAGEKAKEIWNDASLTIEEKQALIAELMADTGRLLNAISEDAQDSFNGMISAVVLGSGIGLENVQEMAANVLEALQTRNEEAIEGIGVPWDEELQSKMELIDEVKEFFKYALDDMQEANRAYLNEIQGPDGVAAVMGEQYGSAQDAINRATDSTNNLYNETLKLYTLFGLESKALDEAKKTLEGYRRQLDAATSGSGAFAKQMQEANKAVIDGAKASGNWITAAAPIAETAFGTGDPTAFSSSSVSIHYSPQVSAIGSAVSGDSGGSGFSSGSSSGNSSGKGSSNKNSVLYRATSSSGTVIGYWTDRSRAATEVLKYGNGVGSVDLVPAVYKSGYTIEGAAGKRAQRGFATGGYTGSWSDGGIDEKDGKWAVLHQKELVLNAEDTRNVLAAVDLVRQMTDTLKVASLETTFNNYGKAQTQAINDTIEQRVQIQAEFPNANSADEIREALLGLADSAMQYSYRER